MRSIIAGAALAALCGCAPTLEQHAAQCQGYGFELGTTALAACVQAEQQAYQARLQAGMMALSQQYQMQQQTQTLQGQRQFQWLRPPPTQVQVVN